MSVAADNDDGADGPRGVESRQDGREACYSSGTEVRGCGSGHLSQPVALVGRKGKQFGWLQAGEKKERKTERNLLTVFALR